MNNIPILPNEIWSSVLSRLPLAGKKKAAEVCRLFYDIIRENDCLAFKHIGIYTPLLTRRVSRVRILEGMPIDLMLNRLSNLTRLDHLDIQSREVSDNIELLEDILLSSKWVEGLRDFRFGEFCHNAVTAYQLWRAVTQRALQIETFHVTLPSIIVYGNYASLTRLTNLRELNLNVMKGACPLPYLTCLTRLRSLKISNWNVAPDYRSYFALTQLQKLHIVSPHSFSARPKDYKIMLNALPSITHLHLNQSNLGRQIAKEKEPFLARLAKMKFIEGLSPLVFCVRENLFTAFCRLLELGVDPTQIVDENEPTPRFGHTFASLLDTYLTKAEAARYQEAVDRKSF